MHMQMVRVEGGREIITESFRQLWFAIVNAPKQLQEWNNVTHVQKCFTFTDVYCISLQNVECCHSIITPPQEPNPVNTGQCRLQTHSGKKPPSKQSYAIMMMSSEHAPSAGHHKVNKWWIILEQHSFQISGQSMFLEFHIALFTDSSTRHLTSKLTKSDCCRSPWKRT